MQERFLRTAQRNHVSPKLHYSQRDRITTAHIEKHGHLSWSTVYVQICCWKFVGKISSRQIDGRKNEQKNRTNLDGRPPRAAYRRNHSGHETRWRSIRNDEGGGSGSWRAARGSALLFRRQGCVACCRSAKVASSNDHRRYQLLNRWRDANGGKADDRCLVGSAGKHSERRDGTVRAAIMGDEERQARTGIHDLSRLHRRTVRYAFQVTRNSGRDLRLGCRAVFPRASRDNRWLQPTIPVRPDLACQRAL